MKKTLVLTLALTSAMALGGCGQTREDRAVNGALLGGAAMADGYSSTSICVKKYLKFQYA